MGEHKTRLLIVERAPGDSRSTLTRLAESGYREFDTATAASLAEARRIVTDHDPDVIALELSLPDSQGLATLMAMRQAAAGKPIVLLTTGEDNDLAPAAIHAGAHDALTKATATRELLCRTFRYAAAHSDADRQRRRSDRRLTSLYEAVPAAIFEIDAAGKLTSVNRALLDMLGYSDLERLNEAMAGHRLFVDPGQVAALAEQIGSDGSVRRAGLTLLDRDGAVVDTLANCVAVTGEHGLLRGYQGSLTDVTRLNALHRELHAARKHESMGKLTEGVAHYFKDLLSTVIGNLYLARQQLPPDVPAGESLALAYEAATRATALTRRLATFAQQQELRPERVNLGELLREIEPLLRRTLANAIEMDIELPATGVCVRVDRAQLENAIIGLVLNADEAMAGEGRLSIRVECHDRAKVPSRALPAAPEAVICVCDDGHGIPAELVEHVFEPFVTTRGDADARGLGLIMVQGFAVQSGGRVDVTSEPGHGAEFRIALPLEADSPDNVVAQHGDRSLPAAIGLAGAATGATG